MMNKPIFSRFPITANALILISCAYLSLVLNFPFLSKVVQTTWVDVSNILFLLSVPLVLFCIFVLLQSLLSSKYILKPILIFTLLLSSLLFYGTWQYGIIFDMDMLQNTIESDTAEAFSYLNLYAVICFVFFGCVPAFIVYKSKIIQQTTKLELLARLKLISLSLLCLAVLLACFYGSYASVGRNHKNLVTYITPLKLYEGVIKYVKQNVSTINLPFEILDATPHLTNTLTAQSPEPQFTVMVLGETARSQNFSLNGYNVETNPYSSLFNVSSFTSVSSCGTATAISLPCMFSRLNKQTYDKHIANNQQNILDIAKLAGVDVTWIDNNNGGCKKVCDRVNPIYINVDAQHPLCDGEFCVDEALLAHLEEKLANRTAQNTLVVLHMIGSHGPTYYKRYPLSHRLFVPDCQRSDIQNCSAQELMNTYDNTIAYTDFVLSQIMIRLDEASQQQNIQTSMLYMSDHGESLGEKGIYLHGLPYLFAPEEQTHIPLIYWQSKPYSNTQAQCLAKQTTGVFSHDNLFDTLLGLIRVSSSTYKPELDIFRACFL